MNDLTLREATPFDSEFAYFVKKAAFREYVERVFGWDEEHQRKLHEKRFPSQTFQVIQLSGVDVGILSTEREADCLKVNQLYILPEHQDGGIGTACMKAVIDDPKNKYIRLQVLKVNRRAIKFYTRLGFNTIGETETHVQMERPHIEMMILRKDTAPRYIREEGITSYLLGSPRTSSGEHLTTTLVEINQEGSKGFTVIPLSKVTSSLKARG